jgi:hypothetical protein|nr:MAG TPA: resistance to inhibitors of cholinesterase-like protein [Caudoviricetes sp.]
MTNFFERIMQIANYEGYKNPLDFAKKGLGWQSSEKINRLKDSNKKPSVDILLEISHKFENINSEWLLTGKGEMLKKKEKGGISQTISGDNNTMSGNDTYIGNSDKETIKELKERLAETERKLEEKDQQISKLINVIEKLNSI